MPPRPSAHCPHHEWGTVGSIDEDLARRELSIFVPWMDRFQQAAHIRCSLNLGGPLPVIRPDLRVLVGPSARTSAPVFGVFAARTKLGPAPGRPFGVAVTLPPACMRPVRSGRRPAGCGGSRWENIGGLGRLPRFPHRSGVPQHARSLHPWSARRSLRSVPLAPARRGREGVT